MTERGASRLSSKILLISAIIVLVAWLQAASEPVSPWAAHLDNLCWTVAFSAATWVAYLGVRDASTPEEAATRAWFARGLVSLTIGQLLWDVQVFILWNPFPGPSDAFYILLGPLCWLGLSKIVRTHLPRSKLLMLTFDVTGFALAALALALTLYLPRGKDSSTLQLIVLTAYPVILLTTSATALVMQLYLRQRWNWRWIALLAGLTGHGAVWMIWNAKTLDNTLANGSVLNLGFSLFTLCLGWGAAGWRLQTNASPRFDRLCEGLLRQLPLAMVSLASVSIGLLILGGGVSDLVRNILLGLGLTTLLFAMFRQTQQLGERDRLLEAERIVAESQAQLQHLAHHDPLTGLPNLNLLRDRAQQALAAADRSHLRVALMFVDLDQFKEVNDSLGHASGDALLQHVAEQLRQILRSVDTVCRQGGDEFTIVLPEIEAIEDVMQVAEKVMSISRSSFTLPGGHELSLSMSVGIAMYPDDAPDFNSLMQCADTAMYRAKSSGRNGYRLYDAQMQQESTDRMQLRAKLARALERHELSLHYQPQLDLQTGQICGVEALLRWYTPELGHVSPVNFIPVAEDSGLIIEIGAWVLQQACQQAANWQREGLPPITMAVNLSVLQFRRGNLEYTVMDALRRADLAPQYLELEITESVLMQDHDKVFATVDRLKLLGVRLAIDDFGTGYSSLSYVKRLQASKLKIDKSFIFDALKSPSGEGIVRAVIEMARVLEMRTVAEGVETEEQCEFLRHNRCDETQGYLFARPMLPAQFAEFLRLSLSSQPCQSMQ